MSPAPSYAARRDASEREIIDVLERAGYSVVQMNGRGTPDLLLGGPSGVVLVEVKTGNAGLTADQKTWHAAWKGPPIHILRNAAQAKKLVRMLHAGPISWEDAHEQAESATRDVAGKDPEQPA